MANYSDLPGLIVRKIVQRIHIEYSLEKILPILKTCRQWRYVGLPIAYHTAYRILIPVLGHGITQETNIDLMKNTNLGGFAKKIHITLATRDRDNVEPLFDVSNIDFAKDFPNVTELAIRNEHVETTAFSTQLAGNLIEIYSNQLKALNLSRISLPNMTHFPTKLTKLKYYINPGDKILLPKINPLCLEELEMLNIPSIGFSHILQYSLMKEEQTHLYNLKKLIINYNDHSSDEPDLQDEQQQKQLIKCPNLRYLALYSGAQPLIDLPQLEFPTHLEYLCSDIYTSIQLNQLSLLPLKSIGFLNIYLFNDEFTDMFYQASNRLLGKLKNAKQAIVNINGTDASNLDVKRLRWKNVTKLGFAAIRYDALVYMVSQIPTLEHIVVYDLVYAEDENPDMMVTSKGVVKSIEIKWCDLEVTTEKMAKYIVKILIALPSLKRISLHSIMHDELTNAIKEGGKQHLHLLEIEVTDVY